MQNSDSQGEQANQAQANQANVGITQPQQQFRFNGSPQVPNMPQQPFPMPNQFQFQPPQFPMMPINPNAQLNGFQPFAPGQPGMMQLGQQGMQLGQQGMVPMPPGMMTQGNNFGMIGAGQAGLNRFATSNMMQPMNTGNKNGLLNIVPPFEQPQISPPLPFLQTQDGSQKPPLNQQDLEDLQKKIADLMKKIREKDNALEEKNEQIEQLLKDKQKLVLDKKKLEKDLQIEKQEKEEDAQALNEKIQKSIQELQNVQKDKQAKQQIVNELYLMVSEKDEEIKKLQQNTQKSQPFQSTSNQNELQQLQWTQKQQQDVIRQQKQQIVELEQKTKNLAEDLNISSRAKEDAIEKYKELQISNDQLKMAIQDIQKKLYQKQEEFAETQNNYLRENNKLANKVKDLQYEIQKLDVENQCLLKSKDYLDGELKNANLRIQQIQQTQQDNACLQEILQINNQKEESRLRQLKDFDDQKNKIIAQMEQQQREQKAKQQELNEKGIAEKTRLIQKLGKIQCCFLMDLYKTNKKIKLSLLQGIQDALNDLKSLTGRDFFVASHCYGYKKKKSAIATQAFTNNTEELLTNLSQQEIEDYIDQPEDIKTSLKIIQNLLWQEKFKLVILIPTSPCHGKKYHDPKKYTTWFFFSKEYDKQPNDDIIQEIDKLIQMDIILLVIRINDDTKVMCNELEKIYSAKKKSHMFFVVSIKNNAISAYQIKNKILKFAGTLIGTDNKVTKTKTNQNQRQALFQEGIEEMAQIKQDIVQINSEVEKDKNERGNNQNNMIIQVSSTQAQEDKIKYEAEIQRIKNQDGALQALCKRGDISQFEKRVETVKFRCKVFKVDLKEGSFRAKKENIEQILFEKNDYNVEKENEWDCIRTKNPFAFGMVKQVYLMKKNGIQDEIYVVKVPIDKGCYQSMKDAVNDCRCHLVAKNLMKIFMDKISRSNPGLPNVVYTNFLLLEEAPNKIWLAERFFKGEFEKYNNNDGYILEIDSPLNQIAQAFSYFTYQEGGFNYIVNDIQGVGNYFTDPAINTVRGNLDETDVGEEGMSNFLGSLQVKKHLCEKLLKSIDIEMD